MKAQRKGRVIADRIHNFGTRNEWVVSAILWLLFPLERAVVPLVQDDR
jgi:hypothetical protein